MADPRPEVRERILAEIRTTPGVHMRELERRVGISFSGIDHHVRRLESEGMVVAFWDGHFRRLFSTDLVFPAESRRLGEADRRLLSACRRPASLAIILNLAGDGILSHGELLARTGKSKATLTYHVNRLVSAGLVRAAPGSSEKGYELVDRERIILLLVTFAEAFRSHADTFADLWLSLREGPSRRRDDQGQA